MCLPRCLTVISHNCDIFWQLSEFSEVSKLHCQIFSDKKYPLAYLGHRHVSIIETILRKTHLTYVIMIQLYL